MKNLLRTVSLLAAIATAFLFVGCASPNPQTAATAATAASSGSAVKAYPLDACLVTGEDLDGGPTTVYNGQEVKFCCSGCLDAFNREPERYMAGLQ